MADKPPKGVAAATLRQLEALGEAHTALGQAALVLAKQLDEGAGMATAAVARELRATMKELTPHDGGDDFAKLMAALSSPVRDASAS